MKPIESEIRRLKERYLESEYPGDLSDILGPREPLSSPLQVSPIHEKNLHYLPLIRWSLVATILLGLTFGLIWAISPSKTATLKPILLSKKSDSKSQTLPRSSLWLSGQTKKVFQKDHAIKNAFLKSTSLAKTQTRLTKSSQAPLMISRRLFEKKPRPASSPPSFWRRPSRWGAISNSKSPPNGNGAKRDTQPKGSNFIPQQNKLTPTYPSRRS